MLRYAHRKRNRNTGDRKETHQHDRNSLWYDDVHDGHGNDDHAQASARLRKEPLRKLTAHQRLFQGALGLVLLVAIPLPGTGAWTGALVADVLDLRMRVALPAIAAGVVIAGCITTAVTCGVAGLM